MVVCSNGCGRLMASSGSGPPLEKSSYFRYTATMKTITAKEAKNRLGQAIDTTLAEGAVMITKNGREAVVLLSVEKYRELTGVKGFIKDELAAAKNQRRKDFSARVKRGQAKATDASMFHGAAAKAKVRYRSDKY